MHAAAIVVALTLAACQSPVAYPVTPASAAASTFQLITRTAETGSMATAWVASNESGRSLLVTAGHACEDGPAEYILLGQHDERYIVFKLDRSDDPDLCTLLATEVVGPPLAVDVQDPYYDEPVAYVGAPQGIYGDGRAPMYRGNYAGGDMVTVIAAPGASGSAIFTSRGVVGVLVMVGRMPGITLMVPRADLLAFLGSK